MIMKQKNKTSYCNIATYKFIALEEEKLPGLCKQLKKTAASYGIKGTILLGTEGINLFLAAEKEGITQFQEYLESITEFQNLQYKYSYSDFVPFEKLFVKVRNEIVTFKQLGISPEQFTAPHLPPQQLKEWLDQNKDIILLDTRNAFEYEIGTFNNAIDLKIDNFREFADALEKFPKDQNKPIVTFCTGGIRCEKAAAYLLKQGFTEVYQLQGGILNYFEQCGGSHYKGDCFVFDDRIALNTQLEPADFND